MPTKPQFTRTFVAAFIATLVARVVAAIPAVNDVIAWVDGVLLESGAVGVTALGILQSVVIGLVIVSYQKIVQLIGDRWPKVETALLGSSLRPVYVTPATVVEVEISDTEAGKQ